MGERKKGERRSYEEPIFAERKGKRLFIGKKY